MLYICELFLNYKNNNLFKKTRLYYLNKLKKDDPITNVYLNFGVYKLLDKKNIIIPLSGYENSKILLCLDENNLPVYFSSDQNGFNNEINKYNDFLLIGDSYVQGMCVNNENNLTSQFRKFSYKTNILAVGGNGPLSQLASFKEYKDDYSFKNVIIFITPDNDYKDLEAEIRNPILIKYLNIKNYKQNLKSDNNKKIKNSILNNYFGNKTDRIFNDFFSVYHFNLKNLGNSLENIFKKKNNLNKNFEYLNDQKLDIFFENILNEFIDNIEENHKKIYIVFNAVNPDILFPQNNENEELKYILINKKLINLKKFLDSKNISYFDYNNYLLQKFDRNNINLIFKKINGRWDHYTENGFYKIVEEANKKFFLNN